ncbi:beta strand repeat-containing protein, partial [Flavobacterium sp.]|uniref:beta strand repeat-containing protein n=1 Tax=Flavobacterium sp. TaxID=239 RepID=UPI002FDEC2FE
MKNILLFKKPQWLFLWSFTLIVANLGYGQVTMTTTGSYTQDFNSLSSTTAATPTWNDNSTISNWYSQRTGSGTTYVVDTGAANGGALYSYGATSNSDRALGTIGSSNAAAGSFAHGVLLRNTSGNTITDIKVTYTLEEWRLGATGVSAQPITVYYKISSSAITALNPNSNSTWTQVAGLTLNSPVNTGTVGALNGNLTANRVTATNVAIPSLSLANDDYIMIKWEDPDHTGTDHGLSIDDVTISWTVAPSTVAPTVTNTTVASITSNSATLAGNVTATGGAAITANGSVYSLTSVNNAPAINGTGVTNLQTSSPGAGTGSFSNGTGNVLLVNRQYSYNAYATNSVGTSYGTGATFYTLAVTPNAPTVGSPTVNTLNVSIDTNDDNPSGTEYAIQETLGQYVQADGSLGVSAVWRTETQWGATVTVTGLSSNTLYAFQVKARNGSNVETGFGGSASGTTNTSQSATIEADPLTAFGSICINTNATQSFDFIGYNLTNQTVTVGPLTGYTFATSLNGTYQASLNYTPDVNGELLETVYVKFTPTAVASYNGSFAISGGGTANSTNVIVSGSGINTVVSVTTGSNASITSTSAVLNGSFTAGCSAVTASGIEYSVNSDFTGSSTMALGGTASPLSPNTTYYYRAFAIDGTGTVYGTSSNFTTSNLSAPNVLNASTVESDSFFANWESVSGATGYRLDVSPSPDFLGSVTTLANWTFPNNPDDNIIDSGVTINNAKTLTTQGGVGTISYAPVQSSTTSAASGPGWDSGSGVKYWQIDISTLGYSQLKLSSAQRSSGTGPRDFKVQYKIGAGAWTDIPGGAITVANNWTTGVLNNVSLPSVCDNQSSVLIRWIMTSNLQVNSGNVASGGTSGIDNILITGQAATYVSGYENLNVGNTTSYQVTGLNAQTTYYYRVRATSTNSTSANSDVKSVTTAMPAPTFASITQTEVQCDGIGVTSFDVNGLLPNTSSTLYYTINGGSETSISLAANSGGLASFTLPLTFANNGQTLQVTSVELTGSPASNVAVSGGNSAIALVVTARVTPTFTQVGSVCSGSTISALPTTSLNGITGTWSPALNTTATTTYTFTPGEFECANSTTMEIVVIPQSTWYRDFDGDGFGDFATTTS